MQRFASVTAAAFIVVAACFADDGFIMMAPGGTAHLMKGHPSVRMVAEEVHIQAATGEVRAVFLFRNEGKAVTVKMGFPEGARKGEATPFLHFETAVDGRVIQTRRVLAMDADNT